MTDTVQAFFVTLFYVVLIMVGVYGWTANIVALFSLNWSAGFTLEGLVRLIGIGAWPIGVVMGFVP